MGDGVANVLASIPDVNHEALRANPRRRPWTSAFIWLAALIVSLPFGYSSLIAVSGFRYANSDNRSHSGALGLVAYGWPVVYKTDVYSKSPEGKRAALDFAARYGYRAQYFGLVALATDIAITLIVFVACKWEMNLLVHRTAGRFSYSLALFFRLFLVVAVAFAVAFQIGVPNLSSRPLERWSLVLGSAIAADYIACNAYMLVSQVWSKIKPS